MAGRVKVIDGLRGIAVLGMVVHHFLFDLDAFFNIPIPVLGEEWFKILLSIGAGIFIFISGTSSVFSHNNIRRGAGILLLAILISLITFLFMPQSAVYFGILHMLGISILIIALIRPVLNKFSPYTIIIFSCILFIVGYWIESMNITVDQVWLFPFGFTSPDFHSSDYFPLIPWLFLLIAGTGFGRLVKERRLPAFFYQISIPGFEYIGKKTLWIYILHQPVIFLVLNLYTMCIS